MCASQGTISNKEYTKRKKSTKQPVAPREMRRMGRSNETNEEEKKG
jgi:hypothetical protein